MKLMQFLKDGETRLGIILENGIVDVAASGADMPKNMAEAIALGDKLIPILTPLAENPPKLIPESEAVFLPPVSDPEKILCIGLNYKQHILEFERKDGVPDYPVIFGKFRNALIAHKDSVRLCKASSQHDYEAEIVIVIGKTCKDVSREEALDYVFGYTLANDISARDLQHLTNQWMAGKSCDTFCPVGPCIATADSVKYNEMHIVGRKNGEIRQESDSSLMIYDIPYLVSFISSIMTLKPGDLILTGTPSGVIGGRPENERDWLKDGDTVSVTVDGIGTLENPIKE